MADVETAEQAAQQARGAVRAAEHNIRSGKGKTTASRLVELVTRSRHADLAAEAARQQAEEQRQAARRQSLETLAHEIDETAATAGTDIQAALEALADAAATVQRLAAAHDSRVAGLADAARQLGCRERAPGGPRSADGLVALTRDGCVQHATTVLLPLGGRLDEALTHALHGDVASALAAVHATRTVPVPQRADLYVRGRGGMILPIYGAPDQYQASHLTTGDLVRLSEAEVLDYLAGDLP